MVATMLAAAAHDAPRRWRRAAVALPCNMGRAAQCSEGKMPLSLAQILCGLP